MQSLETNVNSKILNESLEYKSYPFKTRFQPHAVLDRRNIVCLVSPYEEPKVILDT